MSENTESTSKSMKFLPMPISALLANLKPLQAQPDSPDASFTSEDDSDSSFAQTTAKKPSTPAKFKKEFSTPSLKVSQPKDIKAFASERKVAYSEYNKEIANRHCSTNQTNLTETVVLQSGQQVSSDFYPSSGVNEEKAFTSESTGAYNVYSKENKENGNCGSTIKTYPSKETVISQSGQKVNPHVYPTPEVKKRNVLMPHNKNAKIVQNSTSSTHKTTPEIAKPPPPKLKSATPKIKSGIRKFTPSSGNKISKKTPIKAMAQNRDRVRCELFTHNQPDEPPARLTPTPALKSVPQTPVNKKPMPSSYAATPSYPQGVVGPTSKVLFKTTSIKDKKYMFIRKLGTGGSSEVYKVLEVGTSCEYAVKCVYLATDPELAQGYVNEVRLLRELQNSDRVIRLYDYEYDRANHFLRMVLEVGETDLSSFLRARAGNLPPALVLHYWDEMLHAVHYIHEHGVIHADLKPANFLLVCGRLKLIDFGIASAISSDATSVVRAQAAGTYSYISPEALVGGAGGQNTPSDGSAPIKISFKSDVWSLGCILYSMVHGRTPFGHIPSLAKLAAILDPNHRIDYPPVEHLPPTLIGALKWCLTYNARARPSVRDLLAIHYLQPARTPQHLMEKMQHYLRDGHCSDK